MVHRRLIAYRRLIVNGRIITYRYDLWRWLLIRRGLACLKELRLIHHSAGRQAVARVDTDLPGVRFPGSFFVRHDHNLKLVTSALTGNTPAIRHGSGKNTGDFESVSDSIEIDYAPGKGACLLSEMTETTSTHQNFSHKKEGYLAD
ncbi:hypothetical protein TR67_06045 [Pseudomonas deceptionensis]|nr:hypothetical protein TR67_06045 [Pseudomonas deceptionensis]